MIKTVLKTIIEASMIEENDKIVLGLSGGADSVALLTVLLQLKKNIPMSIIAVHINHGIRLDAYEDQQFVENLCKKENIELFCFTYNLEEEAAKRKIGLEEAGREIRYEAFDKIAEETNADKIAVAHNKNDHVETILYNIFRGCGLNGLGGIKKVRGNIIRPLLDCTRAEIELFLQENDKTFRQDSTNLESIYTRNKIRLNILPYIIREINPNFMEALGRLSEIALLENEFLEFLEKRALENCTDNVEQKALKLEVFNKYDDVMKKRIIRKAYEHTAGSLKDFSSKHIDIIKHLCEKETGKKVMLPGGIIAEKKYNLLFFSKIQQNSKDFCYNLPYNEFVFISEIDKYVSLSHDEVLKHDFLKNTYTKLFYLDENVCELSIRNKRPGDRIYFDSLGEDGGHKKLKDFFIDSKVPRDERNSTALLTENSDVLWIINPTEKKQIFSNYYEKKSNSKKAIYIQLWEGCI